MSNFILPGSRADDLAGRAGELDQSILFLLGPGSSFVTGHVLTVDGGMAVR